MAKKVKGSTITRFEYTVINEKFYLEIEDGKGKLWNKETKNWYDEEFDFYYCYIKRGKNGFKKFLYGCPVVDVLTNEKKTPENVAEDVERFMISSVCDYIKEEESIDNYYNSICNDD